MDNVIVSFVFDRRGITKDNAKKEAPIHVRVYEPKTRIRKYIHTNESILKSQYSDVGTGGLSIIKHPNAAAIKARIDKIFAKVQAFVYSDKCETMEDVENWNKEDDLSTTNVVEFIKADLKRREVTLSVLEYNNSFIKRLEEFGKIITFADLTYSKIEDLDIHLKKTIKSQPTLYKRHSLFKGYLEKARRRGLIERNPYDEFTFKKGKSDDPVYLIESEVKQIINYKPRGAAKESLERVRDLFIFQCYTGLSYTDLESFSRDSIQIINGQKEIHGIRNKTGVPYVVLLLPIAEEIADKYDYILPVISNQKYNDYLGTLIERIGIDKNVTTHTGRHTFGTYLINKGVSIEAIPKIMGHTNMKQSLLYARMLGVTAINEMKDKLLDKDEKQEE